MKIAAGENQKTAPQGIVYVVTGLVEHEGGEVLAVTTSRKLANLAIMSDKAVRRVENRRPFDDYMIRRFKLDTAVYQSGFFTNEKVRAL
jgi:hypothetical protein